MMEKMKKEDDYYNTVYYLEVPANMTNYEIVMITHM